MTTYNVGGVGDPYASIEEALAVIPTSRTQDHDILVDKQAEYVYTAGGVSHLTISGFTGNFYIRVKPKTGHSLRENISPGSDALKYDASKGVAIKSTGGYSVLFDINNSYVELIDLQLKTTHPFTHPLNSENSGITTPALFDRLLIDSDRTGSAYCLQAYGASTTVQRTIVYLQGSGGRGIRNGNGGTIRDCAVIRNSEQAAAQTGYSNFYGAGLKNSIALGFTTPADASGWSSSSNNASDQTSGLPGTSNVYSIGEVFENRDKDTLDLRTKTGTTLASAGSTALTADFAGTARPGSPTIGAWEPVAAGGGTSDIAAAYVQGGQVAFFGIGAH